MGRWKRNGVIVILYATDHDPKHVHIYEDGKRTAKFDIQNWRIMEGRLTSRVQKVLEDLNKEGVFDEKPKV